MTPKKWRVRNDRTILRKPPWLTVRQQEVELPNGHVIPDYLVTEIPDVAMIFPVTTEGNVVLVEQYKHGLGRNSWDLPAGYLDPGEDPLAGARRELEEETGFVSADWRPLLTAHHDVNRNSAAFHYFLALDARAHGDRHLDDTEDIDVHQVPLDNILSLVDGRRITSLHSIAGIHAALHRLGHAAYR